LGIEEVRSFIDRAPAEDGDFEGAVTEGEIADAESQLGVAFPPSYRQFVASLGLGDVNSREFYGLIPGKPVTAESGVPSVGISLRERLDSGLPASLVIVSDTGMGEWYVLDTSERDADGECPVKIWSPGTGDFVPGERFDDFGEFALGMLNVDTGD